MIHLTAQAEAYAAVLPEMRAHYPAHWRELALDQESIALDMDYARYAQLDAAGALSVVTLRCKGALVGYCIMLVMPGLHYRSTPEARMDIYYVAPDYRGRMGGVRLFRAVEKELKRRGIKRIYVGSKLHRDSSRLFVALGYRPIETWFSKLVEG